MRGRVFLYLLALAVVSCVRPSSREFFVLRENAEYGDTYSFFLDLSDSSATYGIDFFTRLERESFKSFPGDDIILVCDGAARKLSDHPLQLLSLQ